MSSSRTSSLPEILRDAAIMGTGSGLMTSLHQIVVGNEIEGVMRAGGYEGALGFLSSSFNLWAHNAMKTQLRKTNLTDQQIMAISVLIISVGSVGLTRYLMHSHINSKSPESIASIYALGNILYMYLYELLALKHDIINNVSGKIQSLKKRKK